MFKIAEIIKCLSGCLFRFRIKSNCCCKDSNCEIDLEEGPASPPTPPPTPSTTPPLKRRKLPNIPKINK